MTGGAGFIGSNASARYLSQGHRVVLIDNLIRPGTERNLEWLRGVGGEMEFIDADIRDPARVDAVMHSHPDTDVILHLAAQVAVTSSISDPRADFEVNALGTLNILEAARSLDGLRCFVYASTNKVYGDMTDLKIAERNGRYVFPDFPAGVPETRQLEFCSPYGCSKGAADQYAIDYARIFDLPTVTFRQSCIYGPRQFGIEDQGWVAWFCIAAALGKEITIYGDGKQVRDVLHIADLLDLFELAIERIDDVAGEAYNVGGGPSNTLSLRELLNHIEGRLNHDLQIRYDDWRDGDQKVFVADISKATRDFGWTPRTGVAEGVDALLSWVQENRESFSAQS